MVAAQRETEEFIASSFGTWDGTDADDRAGGPEVDPTGRPGAPGSRRPAGASPADAGPSAAPGRLTQAGPGRGVRSGWGTG